MSYLLDPNQNKIQIDILFCIATEKARTNIKNNLDDYLKSVNWQNKVEFNIHIVQLLEDKLSNDIKNNKDLVEVLKKDEHFVEECVISKSYKVGKMITRGWVLMNVPCLLCLLTIRQTTHCQLFGRMQKDFMDCSHV